MKKKISGIYKIENLINHKVYIGQSIDIYNRWNRHKTDNKLNKKYPLYLAFKKYGIENFSFEVIKETYDLDYWEIFLIQIYKSTDSNFGYNITNGGKALRGKDNPFYGKHHTIESNIKNAKNHKHRSVKCIETNEIFEFAKDASKKYNLCESHITACCKGLQKTCGKLHWIYVDAKEGEFELNLRKGKSYYYVCKDPIKNDFCVYYTMSNRIQRHNDLYKSIKIHDCIIKKCYNKEESDKYIENLNNGIAN